MKITIEKDLTTVGAVASVRETIKAFTQKFTRYDVLRYADERLGSNFADYDELVIYEKFEAWNSTALFKQDIRVYCQFVIRRYNQFEEIHIGIDGTWIDGDLCLASPSLASHRKFALVIE